jgi:tetratricopeptide (TPR) repeat protein
MTVSGDLASIDLSDLLQNMETHGRTGTLALQGATRSCRIHFEQGRISMFAGEGRPPLGDMLVAAGILSAKKMDAAQRKARGSRKSLIEILVASRTASLESLRAAAEDFLIEDVANLVASAEGTFEFKEGDEGEGFDPDERFLELALPVGPLILEATRRVDHWVLIRKAIPSDTVHFIARETAECSDQITDPGIGAALLAALDGTRSVTEVVDLFPSQRFMTFQVLSELIRDRLVRAAEADDLVNVAGSVSDSDPERARKIIARGLEAEPHHMGLLTLEAELAEEQGQAAAAASALKMIAHLEIEAGRIEEAKDRLEHAKLLTPSDTAIWERTLTLALQQGRRQDAVAEGLTLTDLYRAPGLHAKAREVLERLLKVEPDSIQLRLEHARTQVDSGDSQEAVRGLARFGKALVGSESYAAARLFYEEILAIEPGNREATLCLELIDKETYARRRERKRRVVRYTVASALVALASTALFLETSARIDLVETTSRVDQDRLLEEGRFEQAIRLFEEVAERHPCTATSFFDVRRRLSDLRLRAAQEAPADPGR